ncbi:hypothetical protein [Streptomyces sp. NBC_00083]|uniref:hypothetical protein n=1 Tax=Streptomyces sp. NBC_00083 TaxID=2975647 RepID=UPI002257812C|nr:hypothetical protein [Streptomyces sp. NBC_00083]MCX5388273.1 hypothetical protein [Streptomyces sp. NBC_00083]
MSGSRADDQAAEDARRREELLEKVREANRLSTGRPASPEESGTATDTATEG